MAALTSTSGTRSTICRRQREQASPSSPTHATEVDSSTRRKNKSAPPPLILWGPLIAQKSVPSIQFDHHLSSLSCIESPNIGIHLSELFANNDSTKFHPNDNHPRMVQPNEGILLSGCQANETSADMNAEGKGGKAYGAFSNAVQIMLKGNESALSNRELVTREDFVFSCIVIVQSIYFKAV
ncbi:metacaspase-9-like [Tasmannia lanceolata]|uniref:metacaspase-9-like n=1 Tax=Tasmannia lanceolata TaxID=3420 RepID=UPI00406356AE